MHAKVSPASILGYAIAICIGLPLLTAAIVGTAVLHTVSKPDVVSTIVSRVFTSSASISKETYSIIETKGVVTNSAAIAWLQAFASLPKDPITFLEDNGMFVYIESETTRAIKNLATEGIFYLGPLKKFIASPTLKLYLEEVMNALPSCDAKQIAAWEFFLQNNMQTEIPGCRPSNELQAMFITSIQTIEAKIPESIQFLPPATLSLVWLSSLAGVVGAWVMALGVLVLSVVLVSEHNHQRTRLFGIWLFLSPLLLTLTTYGMSRIPGQANLIVGLALPIEVTGNWTPELVRYVGNKIIEVTATFFTAITPSLYAFSFLTAAAGTVLIIISIHLQKSAMLKK